MTLQEHADYLVRLLGRTRMKTGETADVTHLTLTADDVAVLDHIALRLERMAPHQAGIERIVRGRG